MSFVGQVMHVFAKDLRHFWPGLAGLGAIVLYHRFIGLPPLGAYGMPYGLAVQVFPLLFAVFAAAVIQDDPITSRDAAIWQTSPLSGLAVLAAKGLFIGIFFGVIPGLVHVQWIVQLAGGGDVPGLLLDSMLYQGGLLAIAALGAAVTPNLGVFLVLGAGAWVGMEAFQLLAVRGATADYVISLNDWGVREYYARVISLGLGVPLLLFHYAGRRATRTAALGVAAFAVSGAGLATTQFDWRPETVSDDDRFAYPGAEAVTLRMTSLGRVSRGDAYSTPAAWVIATVVPEVGTAVTFAPAANRSRLTGPRGGVTSEFDARDYFLMSYTAAPTGPIAGLRAVGPSARLLEGTSMAVPVARGTVGEIDALGETFELETTVSIDAFEPHVLAEIPLVEGASSDVRLNRLTVESVARLPGEMHVQVRSRRATRALESFAVPGLMRLESSLVLYNAPRDEYLLSSGARSGGGRPFFGPMKNLVAGTRFHDSTWSLSFRLRASGDQTASGMVDDLPDDWLDDASLVLLDVTYAGSFERTFVRPVPEWPVAGRFVTIDEVSRPEGER